MKIHSLLAGYFKLDGGAMFGIVPKQMWARLNEPDGNNMCQWALRCLLIETESRKILIDTGMGDKQSEKFRKYFEPHGDTTLLSELQRVDLKVEDITDVILTHLHFDHCGGAVVRLEDTLLPAFPNAKYWVSRRQYESALQPNEKERASFLKENFVPLMDHGVLNFIETDSSEFGWSQGCQFTPEVSFQFAFGHTEAMIIPIIKNGNETLVYAADLMPSHFHLGIPYVMAYDIRPLQTLREKVTLLDHIHKNDWSLVFEHDPTCVAAKLDINERGKFVVKEKIDI